MDTNFGNRLLSIREASQLMEPHLQSYSPVARLQLARTVRGRCPKTGVKEEQHTPVQGCATSLRVRKSARHISDGFHFVVRVDAWLSQQEAEVTKDEKGESQSVCLSELTIRALRSASWAASTHCQPASLAIPVTAIAPDPTATLISTAFDQRRLAVDPPRLSPSVGSPLHRAQPPSPFRTGPEPLHPPHTSLSVFTPRDQTPLSTALSFSNASYRTAGRCFPARWCGAPAALPKSILSCVER
ncbi:hypothetical protein HBH51_036210 [Parastagonospora nodorum]|nr:hypothetical protein HBH51_036210 [Parastagonospora nodorum]